MKILGVTSCPSGVVLTYMAAEAIEVAAQDKGWEVKVETQGAMGIENEISESDVVNADVVILTQDMEIKKEERFVGKHILRIRVADAVKNAPKIMEEIEAMLAKV